MDYKRKYSLDYETLMELGGGLSPPSFKAPALSLTFLIFAFMINTPVRTGRPVEDLTGKVFIHLTVLSKNDRKRANGGSLWNCQCICGKLIVCQRSNLTSGHSKSCGCLHPRNGYTIMERFYNLQKYDSGRKRKLTFLITLKEFSQIVIQPCHYCGIEPYQIYDPGNKSLGIMLYNGIDRKDSSIGYESGNCVPCCGHCNIMKHKLGYDQFLEKIVRIYRNRCTEIEITEKIPIHRALGHSILN